MKIPLYLALVSTLWLVGAAQAQAPVQPASDPDALFHDPDPKLHANKQVAYHVIKDLLEANHWELASKYLTERYIQHNPNFPSGRDNLVQAVSKFAKPQPIAAKMTSKVVAVVAEGDLVVVANVLELPDPKNPGKKYTSTGFDMWRIKDGKADEHWDAAMLGVMPPAPPGGSPPPPGQ